MKLKRKRYVYFRFNNEAVAITLLVFVDSKQSLILCLIDFLQPYVHIQQFRFIVNVVSDCIVELVAIIELALMGRYEVLGMHEFDSVRKRMSVIVECPDKSIKLLVKGADTTVLEIVGNSSEVVESSESMKVDSLSEVKHCAEVLVRTLGHLDNYSREGLRTLVVASKELTQREVQFLPCPCFLAKV